MASTSAAMAPPGVFLALANLLIPVAILGFATGFFPYKPFMPGLAEYEELDWKGRHEDELKEPPTAPFDKLVFMVVDALRSDFVYSNESGMSFVQRFVLSYICEPNLFPTDDSSVSFATVPLSPSQPMLPPLPSPCLA